MKLFVWFVVILLLFGVFAAAGTAWTFIDEQNVGLSGYFDEVDAPTEKMTPLDAMLPQLEKVELAAWEKKHGPIEGAPAREAAFKEYFGKRAARLARFTFKQIHIEDPEMNSLVEAYRAVLPFEQFVPGEEKLRVEHFSSSVGFHFEKPPLAAQHFVSLDPAGRVVGFVISYPFERHWNRLDLETQKAIAGRLPRPFDPRRQYYLAATGVLAAHRRLGLSQVLGLMLVDWTRHATDASGQPVYHGILSFTQPSNEAQRSNFEKQGFRELVQVAKHDRVYYYLTL